MIDTESADYREGVGDGFGNGRRMQEGRSPSYYAGWEHGSAQEGARPGIVTQDAERRTEPPTIGKLARPTRIVRAATPGNDLTYCGDCSFAMYAHFEGNRYIGHPNEAIARAAWGRD